MKKLILVTGATDGIGKMTAQLLAAKGHQVIVHGRDKARVEQAILEIKSALKNPSLELESSVFDLSSFASVKSGVSDLLKRFSHIDVLLNNAGTYQTQRLESKDGFELTMAVNHLGPTLLTWMLKPLLEKSSQPRVIFVASIAHNRGRIDSHDYNFDASFSAYPAYAASKLANVIAARQLAQAWKTSGINVYSLHPGVITTKLLKIGFNVEGDSVEAGSETSVFLAAAELDKNLNGEYFVNKLPVAVSAQAKNEKEVSVFWQWTINSIGVKI